MSSDAEVLEMSAILLLKKTKQTKKPHKKQNLQKPGWVLNKSKQKKITSRAKVFTIGKKSKRKI